MNFKMKRNLDKLKNLQDKSNFYDNNKNTAINDIEKGNKIIKSVFRFESANNRWFFSDINEIKSEFSKRKNDDKDD